MTKSKAISWDRIIDDSRQPEVNAIDIELPVSKLTLLIAIQAYFATFLSFYQKVTVL